MQLPVTRFSYNPEMEGFAEVLPDIVYSTATGQELKLTVIAPWRDREKESAPPKRPLIVFVQGSAFTFPNIHYELPQLSRYAQQGYVVATVTHRNCLEGHPFPAYLQDVKTAIRFLRKSAGEFGIDPGRVGIWGTSSGGCAALLVGLTAGDPEYDTGEHADYSDEVKCVVDCFGPTELTSLYETVKQTGAQEFIDIFLGLMGGTENPDLLRASSPIHRVLPGKAYPPFLLIHGDADTLVPYEQSLRMYEALAQAGCSAEMVCVENGPHEGSFWSWELHGYIMDFFKRNL